MCHLCKFQKKSDGDVLWWWMEQCLRRRDFDAARLVISRPDLLAATGNFGQCGFNCIETPSISSPNFRLSTCLHPGLSLACSSFSERLSLHTCNYIAHHFHHEHPRTPAPKRTSSARRTTARLTYQHSRTEWRTTHTRTDPANPTTARR